eukprot:10786264-Alexandrium_andersonii.AAC.1
MARVKDDIVTPREARGPGPAYRARRPQHLGPRCLGPEGHRDPGAGPPRLLLHTQLDQPGRHAGRERGPGLGRGEGRGERHQDRTAGHLHGGPGRQGASAAKG